MLTAFLRRTGVCLGAVLLTLSGCSFRNSIGESVPEVQTTSRSGVTASSADSEMTAEFCQAAAEEFAAAGQAAEAIAMFDQAAMHDQSLADGNAHRLAVLHARTGNTQQAMRQFKRALELTPGNANLHNDYGFCLLTQGERDLAEEQFRHALQLDPDNARAAMNLGLVAAEKGDVNGAKSQFAAIVGDEAARVNAAALTR